MKYIYHNNKYIRERSFDSVRYWFKMSFQNIECMMRNRFCLVERCVKGRSSNERYRDSSKNSQQNWPSFELVDRFTRLVILIVRELFSSCNRIPFFAWNNEKKRERNTQEVQLSNYPLHSLNLPWTGIVFWG